MRILTAEVLTKAVQARQPICEVLVYRTNFQDKLARLADVAHATIIKIKSGKMQSPTIDTVQKIAKALGVDDLIK